MDEVESGLRNADRMWMQKGTETELTQRIKKKKLFLITYIMQRNCASLNYW